jgi:hypothetical protein
MVLNVMISSALARGIEHPLILGPAVPCARGEVDELRNQLKTPPGRVVTEVTKLHLGVLSLVDSGNPRIERRTHAKPPTVYTFNGPVAIGAVQALRAAGRQPGEVAVTTMNLEMETERLMTGGAVPSHNPQTERSIRSAGVAVEQGDVGVLTVARGGPGIVLTCGVACGTETRMCLLTY